MHHQTFVKCLSPPLLKAADGTDYILLAQHHNTYLLHYLALSQNSTSTCSVNKLT